ncbi:receptor kinase-like protein Xa21 [Actinidia eriantha]|uniref:receptor kinase-like protein Xa21 n=1 Tax=Actinidia eriantha TaxID=165200 RepID=UPI002586F07D|nr:receptor kinase-like protein Xa21 [Actinidia eriantha]XP_057459454.1 receptor kinase-like protein Xa21 [Actinidia eriantha]XP_057459455.1 receptor kinase-like protein Xa21 [Actinidia eriantha]
MSSNRLSGRIPSNIFNISTLEMLDLAMNNLSGYLPSSIGRRLPNIKVILLGGNKLTGIIPSSIANASKLNTLDLSHNSFAGYIPDTLGNLELLWELNFVQNNLTCKSATMPSCFASLMKCKNLMKLWIASNPLNVILPANIGNMSNLESIWAWNCKIMGNVPKEIGNLSNLISIHLQNNYLSGSIPATVGQLRKLQYLSFKGNKLQRHLPNSLCEVRDLAYLFLGGNKLFGSLPTCFDNLTFLRSLQVESNAISEIPLTIWNVKGLLDVNFSSNSLSSELPWQIGNLKNVKTIDMSMNQLSGNIPGSIGSLHSLFSLSLANNRFEGHIPQSVGSLISMEFLDLSRNNLSGAIPKSMEQLLYLKYLNLSSNKLEGEIPKGGPFANFTAQSFMWNKALCGAPRFQASSCPSARQRSREKMVLVLKFVLPIIASIVLIILILVSTLTRCQRRNMRIPNEDNLVLVRAPKRFSYQELLQATNGFAECNLLGMGSFSSVYKGILSDGLIFAIKVFDMELEGSSKSFDIECKVMRNLRHRNLIKVIGSCSNLDFKALVVDYMPNGNLEKWLHNVHGYCLDILQRMNIMIDVASALEYLHYGYLIPVVHCDVKPSNVLLDEDMVAHLGDYGIAKLLSKQESMAQTETLATIGYIAPEYGSEGMVSIKGDVYSYGVMLLETFTGRKPMDELFIGEMNFMHWVNKSLHCAVLFEVMDANILRKEDEHFIFKEGCIKSILELAISCCAESPEDRVNMKDVIAALKKIKDAFLTNIPGAVS